MNSTKFSIMQASGEMGGGGCTYNQIAHNYADS
jgi:hypothetical protein